MKTQILGVTFSITMATAAHAALIAYDGFNYVPGQAITSQTGWSASGTGDSILVASGNLSVTNLQPSTGNLLTFTGDGADARLTFNSQSTDTFFSFAFKVTDLASLDATGGYFASLSSTSANYGAVVWLRRNGGGFDIGGSSTPTSAIQWNTNGGSGYAVAATHFLVGSYEFRSGVNNDVTNLWLYPEPFSGSTAFGGSAGPSAIQVANITATDLGDISGFILTQFSATGTPTMQFDELRVGQSYGEVTPVIPEPATTALLLGGVAMLSTVRRRLNRSKTA
ncbi:MAG: hypothetical protein RIQ79_2131 [Verrucomicrobiota bacterium]|jgi:hypothetical protein